METSKSRSIQSELLRMVEGFVDGTSQRPDNSSNEWNLVGSGDAIEDWEFTNEAIKSLLGEHYQNKGNPFTQVKIDSRGDLYLNETGSLSSPYSAFNYLSIGNNLILSGYTGGNGGFAGMQQNAYVNSSGSWTKVCTGICYLW